MESLLEQILLQAPSVGGLLYAVLVLSKQNTRLIEAIIQRENCDDDVSSVSSA